MTDELSEQDKQLVAMIVGDKIKEEFIKFFEDIKQKAKLAESRYELTQQKLDRILEKLEK